MSGSGRLEEYGIDPVLGERLKVVREIGKHHDDRIVYYVDNEGRKHGTYRRYSPGSKGFLLEELLYKHGTLDGPFTTFHPINGKIEKKGTFANGQLHGPFQQWYPDGTISHTCTYNNSMFDGIMMDYYNNGKPMQERHYIDGICVLPIKTWNPDISAVPALLNKN